jgi:hypothetical protein
MNVQHGKRIDGEASVEALLLRRVEECQLRLCRLAGRDRLQADYHALLQFMQVYRRQLMALRFQRHYPIPG